MSSFFVGSGRESALEKLGIEKAIIGGGSFGGLVALKFVLDYPQKVEALILSDTTSNSAAVMPFMDMMLPVLSGRMLLKH